MGEKYIKKFIEKIHEIIRSLYLLDFEFARILIDELKEQNSSYYTLGEGIFSFYMGDFFDASKIFETLYKSEFKPKELFYYWGVSLKEIDELNKALHVLEEGSSLFPDDKHIISELGKLYIELGMPAKAIEKLKNEQKKRAGNYESFKSLGEANLEMNNFDKAIEFFSLALNAFPYDEKLMEQLKTLYIKLDKVQDGIKFFKGLLKKRQLDRLPILYNLGILYIEGKKEYLVSGITKKLESMIVKDYFAIIYLIKLLFKIKKYKKIKTIINKYINEDIIPEIKATMVYYGVLIFISEGRIEKAKELLLKGLKFQPYSEELRELEKIIEKNEKE